MWHGPHRRWREAGPRWVSALGAACKRSKTCRLALRGSLIQSCNDGLAHPNYQAGKTSIFRFFLILLGIGAYANFGCGLRGL